MNFLLKNIGLIGQVLFELNLTGTWLAGGEALSFIT
jgi:hypothetical protein